MYMDFDRQTPHSKPKSLKKLLSEKQQTAKIVMRYRRTWHVLQTLFLEDLISP